MLAIKEGPLHQLTNMICNYELFDFLILRILLLCWLLSYINDYLVWFSVLGWLRYVVGHLARRILVNAVFLCLFLCGFITELEKHLPDLHVLISTPFHPAYVTAERIKKAKNLQLLLTAGIGSDHIDLNAAAAAGLTVAEVTGSNTVSVAEDELMRILILVRNFLPGYHQASSGEWNVAGIAHRAYDLEGKTVGTVGAGRIGRLLLQRLKPFNCNLLYHDRLKIDPELENQLGAKFEEDLDKMLPKCDIIVINTPLTDKTRYN